MTAAVYRSGTPSLGVPQTQNTAPVLEFNCLYTHDIRRKQKRWQDGFLRFHTFNKRVMVYDVPRNFIGDTHWKSGEVLQDGDEVMLEKDGVMVQVAESVGRTETDLTELRQSRKKNSSEKGSSSPVRPSRPPAPTSNAPGNTPVLGLKHRSLNALLGAPKGPIGKAALPTKSPFEERQANLVQQDFVDDRPAKRQRVEQPLAWKVVRPARPMTPQSEKEVPLWARTADSAKQKKKAAVENGQRTLATKEVIDLCEDTEEPRDRFLPGFSSDALAPSSPPPASITEKAQKVHNPPVRSSSAAFETPAIPVTAPKAATIDLRSGAESKRVSKRQGVSIEKCTTLLETVPLEKVDKSGSERNDGFMDAAALQEGEKPGASGAGQSGKTEVRPSRTLRIAASSSKKKKLLCQDQLSTKSVRVQNAHNNNTDDAAHIEPFARPRSPKTKTKTQREQLQERLAKITAKENADDSSILLANSDEMDQRRPARITRSDKTNGRVEPQLRSISSLQQNALELAELDQMIMPPVHPPSPIAEISPRETRQLRRVVSETNAPPPAKSRRITGAPVRCTPSPAKKLPSAASSVAPSDSEASPVRQAPILPARARPKKSFQRAVSLNTKSNGTSTVILSKPFQTPKAAMSRPVEQARAPDPWSREAFDLFTWRPPEWDEDKWCLKPDAAA
jgi:hypothetical protein